MSAAKHTPGPWVRAGTIAGGGRLEIDLRLDDAGENWVTIKGDRDRTVEANASLIAAAPALADALEQFRRRHPKCVIAATGAETRCAACVAADNALRDAGRLP